MLKINRLVVEIKTQDCIYGIDESFVDGLNFIASNDNTCGKSSILAAIYYCLGLEEIIGGRGEKVLTSVYKTIIEDGNTTLKVLESGACLEISNGKEIVTIVRTAKMENRDSKLITVYHSEMQSMYESETVVEDMYVHMPNSANHDKGFHSFLENFLNFELPLVPASDDVQRKLYLQLVFSGVFIEQKHGWADIFSGMPILGIREAKKRVLEFLMKLDTLDNEKKKAKLRQKESSIKTKWDTIVKEVTRATSKDNCVLNNFPLSPRILTKEDLKKIKLHKMDYSIEDFIEELVKKQSLLKSRTPKIIDNFESLNEELILTEEAISDIENEVLSYRKNLMIESDCIRALENNLEIINSDIRNNKDASRLRKLGSDLNCVTAKNICPVCSQNIQDTLLPLDADMPVMGIEENIRHLEAQKEMLTFSLKSHKQNESIIENNIENLRSKMLTLRKLAQSIRSDLYSTNEEISEAIIYKRLQIENDIEKLKALISFTDQKSNELLTLSEEWKEYLVEKEGLPIKKFTKLDEEKIKELRSDFINNLKLYGYKSVMQLQDIQISDETYLPIIENFDMKFDCSASDNVRAIWAFTVALLQTSLAKKGNHPKILIFDEPDQQSIIINDMEQFFKSIITLNDKCQVIIGITVKDRETRQIIKKLPSSSYKLIQVGDKAFKKLSK